MGRICSCHITYNDSWHQDLVYNTMWLLLVQLEWWNKASDAENCLKIQMVLMTGLGTGTGGIGVANAHSR